MNRIKVKNKTHRFIQVVMGLVAFLYALYAFSLLIMGSSYRINGLSWSRLNWVPFKTISFYLFNPAHLSVGLIFDNLIGNILVFMPFGFFIGLFYSNLRKVPQIVFLSFSVSVLVEITQGFLGVGSVDIDDVILNTLGGFVGYICFIITYKMLEHLFDWGKSPDKTVAQKQIK